VPEVGGRQRGWRRRSRLWRLPVLVSFVYLVACRLFALVLLLARSDGSKELELLVLRHELSILRRQARRSQLIGSDRVLLAALSRVVPRG
jgi:putative transposase